MAVRASVGFHCPVVPKHRLAFAWRKGPGATGVSNIARRSLQVGALGILIGIKRQIKWPFAEVSDGGFYLAVISG